MYHLDMSDKLIVRIKKGLLHRDPNIALVSFSIVCNFFMTCAKIGFGIYLKSGWLLINAMYVVALGTLRGYVLKKYVYAKTIADFEEKYEYGFNVHRLGGALIFAVAGTYLICCLRMYYYGDAIAIGGKFVYCFVVFTLIKFVIAIYGMIITRHRENLIIRLMKVVGTVDATISAVPTTYAVLSVLNRDYSADFSAFLGIIISIGVMISGIVMIGRKYNYRAVAHLMQREKIIEDYFNQYFSSRKT